MSLATRSAPFRSISDITTFTPFRASAFPMASPSPEPPPVTIATLSFMVPSLVRGSVQCSFVSELAKILLGQRDPIRGADSQNAVIEHVLRVVHHRRVAIPK